MASILDMLETIRDNSDSLYQQIVPAYDQQNLNQVGNAIMSNKNVMNTFVKSLVNKIAESEIKSKMFNNPLAKLKKGKGRPYGSTIEEIFINPATDTGFDEDGTKLLKTTKPDGKACYFGLNRKGSFPVSITQVELQQAFQSEQAFQNMYNKIINSCYSGDNIKEFELMKGVVARTIDEDVLQFVEFEDFDAKEIAKAIYNLSELMPFPSKDFCAYNKINAQAIASKNETSCITFCDTADQVLLIRTDVQTEIIYEVLVNQFNMDIAQINAMKMKIDNIPSVQKDVYAVLCDKEAIQVKDVIFQMEDHYNPSNMTWNFWLQHWQYIYISSFANAVYFGVSKTKKLKMTQKKGTTGKSIITLSTFKPGSTYKYVLSATPPTNKVGDVISSGTTFTNGLEIAISTDKYLTIYELDSANKIIEAGTSLITEIG